MLSIRGRLRALVLLAASPPALLFADDVVTVAVASNFAKTAAEISVAFTQESGVSIRISGGSTGKLYAQIVNGAPFDVFLSADAERPVLLEQGGFVMSGSRHNYAIGRLALWSRDDRLRGKDCREALQRGDYGRLALANPKTAPYGLAAREVLEAAGLWESALPRAVFGGNISQTLQFVATGNATLGFVALSQTRDSDLPSGTCMWVVPASSHSALNQQAVLLKRARGNDGAQRFIEYLRTPSAKKIISQNGYGIPDQWTP